MTLETIAPMSDDLAWNNAGSICAAAVHAVARDKGRHSNQHLL
jgi:hypothetical protein